MSNNEIRIKIKSPKLAGYQRQILDSEARFTITEASTKSGKTFSHIWWLFKEAHNGKPGYNYWWVAPVYGQAEIAFNRMRRKVATNPLYQVNLSKMTITTPLQTVLVFKSAEKPDNLYGEDVYAAVFDEFTRAREESWYALRSTLTATGGKCKLIGNAKGKKNWGYKLGSKARAGEPGYAYFKITAYDAVAEGILDAEEIEQAKRDLPENVFRELYLAEASEDGNNPFGYTFIKKCIADLSPHEPICFGVDLAKSVDWTVVTGLDHNGQVCYFDRWQGDWQTTKNKLNLLPFVPMAIDSTGVGDPIVEEFQRVRSEEEVEGVKFTTSSKQQLMEGLAVGIQNQEITFPAGVIEEELESFEYEYTRTGVRYSAPEGMHDDCVVSLALAYRKWKEARIAYYTSSLPFTMGKKRLSK